MKTKHSVKNITKGINIKKIDVPDRFLFAQVLAFVIFLAYLIF